MRFNPVSELMLDSRLLWLLVACFHLAACNSTPLVPASKPVFDAAGPTPVLSYYQTLSGMNPGQLNRERTVLAALPPSPNTQLRMAIVLGHPRAQQDLARATNLLEGVLKSTDPAALALHPLAKILIDNFSERQKLEGQLDKQGQQLKESQRKSVELQEKIDGLAEIERTLPSRTQRPRPANSGVAK